MVIYPVDEDEMLKSVIAPDKWAEVIKENEDKLDERDKFYLEHGPPEYIMAVFVKLGIFKRVTH